MLRERASTGADGVATAIWHLFGLRNGVGNIVRVQIPRKQNSECQAQKLQTKHVLVCGITK